jgi:TolA-binding protein
MRFHLVGAMLLAACAAPALAQKAVPVEKRIERIEQQLRAVQRKVFPGGNVEPEIRPQTAVEAPSGVPAGTAVADLTARLDAIEAQLATMTGQVEQNGFRMRQMEEAMNRFKADAEARLAQMEAGRSGAPQLAGDTAGPAAQAEAEPPQLQPEPQQLADTATSPPSTGPASSGDSAEEAYNAGFRLWEQKKYAEARTALEAMAAKYPKHAKASWARNLAGRAYLDDGKPAAAAKVFLNNYQTNPKGERAPDSLLYLGEALTKLGKAAEACQVYGELQDVYGPTLRAPLRAQLPKARAAAKCGG